MLAVPESPPARLGPLFESLRTDWFRCMELSDIDCEGVQSCGTTVFALINGPGHGLVFDAPWLGECATSPNFPSTVSPEAAYPDQALKGVLPGPMLSGHLVLSLSQLLVDSSES